MLDCLFHARTHLKQKTLGVDFCYINCLIVTPVRLQGRTQGEQNNVNATLKQISFSCSGLLDVKVREEARNCKGSKKMFSYG